MADEGLQLDPRQTALIMVDMQNDFCHPEGFFIRNRDLLTPIGIEPRLIAASIGTMRELLVAAREAGLFIAHTQIVQDPDSFNQPKTLHRMINRTYAAYQDAPGPAPILPGSWGAATCDDLAPLPGEYLVLKSGSSSFYQTDLEMVLRRREIGAVIVAGTITYACVLHTALDAVARDLDVVIPSDAVASWAPDLQEPTLRIADLIVGAVVPTSELLKILNGARVAR